MTDLNDKDLSALAPFLSNDSHAKLLELMKSIRRQAQNIPETTSLTWDKYGPLHFEYGAVRDYLFYPDPELTLEWGLSPGDNPEIFQKESLPGLQFFVYLQGPSVTLEPLNKTFGRLMGESNNLQWWGKAKKADEFLSEGSFTEEVFRWLKPAIEEGLKLLRIAAGEKLVGEA